jgi:DNA polymerase elongation subunit (family B)
MTTTEVIPQRTRAEFRGNKTIHWNHMKQNLEWMAVDWTAQDEPTVLEPGTHYPPKGDLEWAEFWERIHGSGGNSDNELDPEMEYDSDEDEQATTKRTKLDYEFVVRCFGVTADGLSVGATMRGFHPFFYIKAPRDVSWNTVAQRAKFVRWLKRLLQSVPVSFQGVELKPIDISADFIERESGWEKRSDFIGFRGGKQEYFYRIVFKNKRSFTKLGNYLNQNPWQKLPEIRKNEMNIEVFETNVDPMLRMIHEVDIQPAAWVKLEAGDYTATRNPAQNGWSRCNIDVVCQWDKIKPVEKNDIAPLLIGSFDLECTSEDGTFPTPERKGDKIIQIGLTVTQYPEKHAYYKWIGVLGKSADIEDATVVNCRTEADLLMAFRDVILELDLDLLTGYNIWGFDMKYVGVRGGQEMLKMPNKFWDMGKMRGVRAQYEEKRLSSSALGDNDLRMIHIPGRVVFDLMKVIQKDYKLDMYKLDFVAEHFIGLNKVDLTPNELFENYRKNTPQALKEIAVYCVQDCFLCNQLSNKLEVVANNIGMANVCLVPFAWLFTRGQGVKIFSLVAKYCRGEGVCIPVIKYGQYWSRRGYPRDLEESSYEGAIVLVATPGIYMEPIAVMDYGSLYPSSMIAENISHDTLVWFQIQAADGSLLYEWGNHEYDNLPGYKYNLVGFDNIFGEGDKKYKSGKTVCCYAEKESGEKGIIPRILQGLLKARKATRKRAELKKVEVKDGRELVGWLSKNKEGTEYVITNENGKDKDTVFVGEVVNVSDVYNDFQKNVLDGLQLAYKITANSLYGQIGAKTSPINVKELAASTTATGREQLRIARDFTETEYPGAKCVYGDSVTGDTPLILRHKESKYVEIHAISAIGKNEMKWSPYENFRPWDVESHGKDQSYDAGRHYEIWVGDHWAEIRRVIRHKTKKRMFRVWTGRGVVDVTEDHSLLNKQGNQVKPNELKLGETELLSGVPFWEQERGLLMERPLEVEAKTKVEAQEAYLMNLKNGIENVRIEYDESTSSYRVYNLNPLQDNTVLDDVVKKVEYLGYVGEDEYVYDVETSSGKFNAGIGEIVVKNTDSVFVSFMPYIRDVEEQNLEGRDAVKRCIELGVEAADRITEKRLKRPQVLEYEKTFYPFVQLSKKRYVGNLHEFDPDKYKLKSMGIVLKRRDNAHIVKTIYGGMIDCIMEAKNFRMAYEFYQRGVQQLLAGEVELKELVITKTLRGHYKDRTKIAHAVLADRMGERDPGNKPQSNDRIPFIYIETPEPGKGEKILQGDKVEHPDYIRENIDRVRPDYRYYYEHQVKTPSIQLLALALEKLPGYEEGWVEKWEAWCVEKGLEGKKLESKMSELREREAERLLCAEFVQADDARRTLRNQERALVDGAKRTTGQLSMARFIQRPVAPVGLIEPEKNEQAKKKLEYLRKRSQKEWEERKKKEDKKLGGFDSGAKTIQDFFLSKETDT